MELDPMQEPKSGPSFFFQLKFEVKENLTFFLIELRRTMKGKWISYLYVCLSTSVLGRIKKRKCVWKNNEVG